MSTEHRPRVAILLATYNGERYVERQLRSLNDNSTPFTVHWVDDHSQDGTRDVVRQVARSTKMPLKEWQQDDHLGVPAAFFHLLECAEADIYLFCDQDDVWQPGKIDATVASLLPVLESVRLSISDPLIFYGDRPETLVRQSRLFADARAPRALEASRTFLSLVPSGHTQGFTRALRDTYLRHKEVARSYAAMHDTWMYVIAVACGSVRLLSDAPTTLYRQHGQNFSKFITGARTLRQTWQLQQAFRRYFSRQAQGFVLAASTLNDGPNLDLLISIARLVSTLHRRQSPLELFRLAWYKAMWPSRLSACWLIATCLFSDA